MWHYHILDTEKYAEDCRDIFGYFVHHFPYFGMRGDEDAQHLQAAFVETQELYVKEFGKSLSELRAFFHGEEAAKCYGSHFGSSDCSKCGRSCTTGKCSPDQAGRVDYSIRPSLAMVN